MFATLRRAGLAALLLVTACRGGATPTPSPTTAPVAAAPAPRELGAGFVPPTPAEIDAAWQAGEQERAGLALYDAQDFAGCATRLEAAAKASGASSAWYNAACCFARAGDLDGAVRALTAAADAGLRGAAQMQSDEDLVALRTDPRWPALVARVEAAPVKVAGDAELARIHDEDQADRKTFPVDWSVVGPRDQARRARVLELVAAGRPQTAEDFYNAALVLQHGQGPDDYLLAHQLCLEALVRDRSHRGARWLAAAAKDRWLQSTGKPQIYGTQYTNGGPGTPWTMEPIDEHAVTDRERAWWYVPTLAEAKARMARLPVTPAPAK